MNRIYVRILWHNGRKSDKSKITIIFNCLLKKMRLVINTREQYLYISRVKWWLCDNEKFIYVLLKINITVGRTIGIHSYKPIKLSVILKANIKQNTEHFQLCDICSNFWINQTFHSLCFSVRFCFMQIIKVKNL